MYLNSVLCVLIFSIFDGINCYRLDKDVVPTSYDIRLQPNIDTMDLKGETTIRIKVKRSQTHIILHSLDLNIREVYFNGYLANFILNATEQILIIKYRNYVIPRGNHILRIKYDGHLVLNELGFQKANFTYNNELVYLLMSGFEPTSARTTFPCFDEPDLKARFKIRLVTPNDTYVALSNMEEIGRFNTSEGVEFVFANSIVMSTYLVTFGMTDFPYQEKVYEDNGRKIPVRVYSKDPTGHDVPLDIAISALKFYSNYTNFSYPLSKLDMIEYNKINTVATENWGLITFKQGILSPKMNIFDSFQINTVMSHELCHFWLGNLVTNEWWNDLWLQEGFASFLAMKAMHYYNGGNYENNMFSTIITDEWDSNDPSMPTPRTVVRYLQSEKEIENHFDHITYYKGARIVQMLQYVIGNDLFQTVIRRIVKDFKYKTLNTDDFINLLEETTTVNTYIRDFIESYLYQSSYPLIEVYKGKENGSYVLQQVPFRKDENNILGARWTIPITYTTDNNKIDNLVWFDKDMDNLTIFVPESSLIILNREHKSLYRVNYNDDLWNVAVDQFSSLEQNEKDAVLNEMNKLYTEEMIDCSVIINIIPSLKGSKRSSYILDSFFNDITYLSSYNETLHLQFRSFIRQYFDYRPYRRELNSDIITKSRFKKCVHWLENNLSEKIKFANTTEIRNESFDKLQSTNIIETSEQNSINVTTTSNEEIIPDVNATVVTENTETLQIVENNTEQPNISNPTDNDIRIEEKNENATMENLNLTSNVSNLNYGDNTTEIIVETI